MKTEIKKLENAYIGLENAHYYLSEAIKNNNVREEDYWFKSVDTFVQIIDELEKKRK